MPKSAYMTFPLILLSVLGIIACGKNNLVKSPSTASRISGTVVCSTPAALSPNEALHVILTDVTLPDAPRAIAEHTIPRPDPVSTPFTIHYDSSQINPEHDYSIQACIRSEDRIRFVTTKDCPLVVNGRVVDVKIILEENVNPGVQPGDFSFSDRSDGPPLQRSIHANLAGACSLTSARYDHMIRARAFQILPPELLSGAHHRVREDVVIRGPQYFFLVDSEFGQYQAQGLARLRRLIREINAIAALKEVSGSTSFKKSFSESALEPFVAFKDLLLHPVDTVTGVPRGLWTFGAASKEAFISSRSQYEDRYVEAIITVSKYKRRYADELGIDVYTSTPEVQKELNRLAWAGAIANWTPGALLLPASGAAKTLYTAFGWTKTLNRIITESDPDSLRYRNRRKLKAMDVPNQLCGDFLNQPYYSPRAQTIITEHLASMEKAVGKARFIEQALKADSEIDAFTYQQIVEILAGYNRGESPIVELMVHKGVPVGYAENGSLVMGIPVDIGRWTPFAEHMFMDFGNNRPETGKIKKLELWISGEFTPRARRQLKKLGVEITENVDDKVGMMD